MRASVVGYSYPPGQEEDAVTIMVKRSGMGDFARTGVGVPLSSQHPDILHGDAADRYRVGEVKQSEVDPETGAVLSTAEFDNTLDGWREFREVSEGKKRQFSTQKSIFRAEGTMDLSDHRALEVACVEQGDNEDGVGFATSILEARLPTHPTWVAHHRDILQHMSTSIDHSNLFETEATFEEMTEHQQPPATTPAPAATPEAVPAAAAPTPSTDETKLKQAMEQRIKEEMENRLAEGNKPTQEERALLVKKYQESEAERTKLEEQIRELNKRENTQSAQSMAKFRKDMAPWFATLTAGAQEDRKKQLVDFEAKMFTADKKTGGFNPTQTAGAYILAAAASGTANAMSKAEVAYKVAAEKTKEAEDYKLRLGVETSLHPTSSSARYNPYDRRPTESASAAPAGAPRAPSAHQDTLFPVLDRGNIEGFF